MSKRAPDPAPLEIRIPWATLVKVAVAVLLAWACVRLREAVELVLFAVLIAIALSPVARSLEKRRLSRGQAVAVLALAELTIAAAFAFLVLPPLVAQVSTLWTGLPALRGRIAHSLRGGLAARILLPLVDLPQAPEVDAFLARPLTWGPLAFEILGAGLVIVVLSLYLASTLFAGFVAALLSATAVPGVLPIALLAALADVIPVAGISVVIAVAVIAALGVSPGTALAVGGSLLGYHLLEAYLLVPRLYGNRLRLSTLTVLLAILGGAVLGGIPGAILALPLVAAYPVIEKHWLEEWLHPDAVADHEVLRETDDARRQKKVVSAVLEGRPADAAR